MEDKSMPQATRSHSTPASRALGKAFAIPFPHRLPKAIRAAVAQAIDRHLAAVDGLVALLDLISQDADLEPSLGYQPYGRREADLEGGDVQDEPHDGADEGDAEPSLAHGNDLDQRQAAANLIVDNLHPSVWASDADFEEEHDGREPGVEDQQQAAVYGAGP
jgi:hypothetical protein